MIRKKTGPCIGSKQGFTLVLKIHIDIKCRISTHTSWIESTEIAWPMFDKNINT